ncbi:TIGR01458 family HAD-type hydrolase [Methylotenera sp.]|uniref:TIGR01458 family HAD-type hydrolase n=1 Tax=Methylotenera sp. TaxID=2051956 RepID=UPI0024886D53|nr:TIGR01458 family HAD-type hydrolase [Methylotenera sp.]MDI1298442.1 TIGR01458 family HAD-type hydrolase [Methylotenera sp.]
MSDLSALKGFLFDLDGVLYTGSNVIEGAVEAIEKLRASHICRFVTNTSTLFLRSLQQKINTLGFAIPANEIISAPQATLLYLQGQQNPVCRLLLAEDVKQDFEVLNQSETAANYIVIGDIGGTWSYSLLNQVFNDLMQGAKLIAIHKNKFWQTEHGLQMDIGGFVDALEYASGVKAMIIGKPSADFFQIALDDMGLKAFEVAMIGDDIDVDVAGSQQIGLTGMLVKTGKYRQSYAEASHVKPDLLIDSIADLPKLLGL